MRKSRFACAICNVPCQIPTISIGEAGAVVAGAAVCAGAAAGALVCVAGGADAAACALAQTPLPTSSNAIAPAALHDKPIRFTTKCGLLSVRFALIAGNPIPRPTHSLWGWRPTSFVEWERKAL